MEFDKTRIAIRERSVLETLDLSLHVSRAYALPLLATMAAGVLPLMLVNELLVGWMGQRGQGEWDLPLRYLWNMTVLVFLEAPLGSVFATAYLGQAVFLERPSLRGVLQSVGKTAGRLAWCHLVTRGVGIAWILLLSLDRRGDGAPFVEGLLLVLLVAGAAALRAFRPFVNEIVLLERNPLIRSADQEITIARRSVMLHTNHGGDLLSRWIAGAILGVLLTFAIYGAFLFCSGVFLHDWQQGTLMLRVLLPLAMWLAASFLAVFRFLSYLDARIRQEGWEVGLLLRAEAARLSPRLACWFLLAAAAAWSAPALAAADGDDRAAIESAREALAGPADYPWYDAETDAIRRVDVRPPRDPAAHRNSTWEASEVEESEGRSGLLGLWFWTVVKWTFWVLLAALLAALAIWLVRAYLRSEAGGGGEAGDPEHRRRREADLIESLPFQVDRPQTDLLSEARRLSEQGDYAQAMVYLFGYQLVHLDQCHAIRLRRGKTNRMILRELRGSPALTGLLQRSMIAFEEVFFGHHPLPRERFEACWSSLDEFHRLLQPAGVS